MITKSEFVADSVAKISQVYPPIDNLVGSQYLYPEGQQQLAYTVPANTRTKIKCITSSIRPASMANTVLNAPNGQGGIVFVAVNGVTVEERAFYGHVLCAYVGSDEQNQPYDCQSGLPTIGEGVVIPSGQALRIGVTPRQATLQVWRVTYFGKIAGVATTRTVVTQTYLTTANQELLTYTPSSDFTLVSLTISCEQPGHIFGGLTVEANGLKTFEAGYIGIEGGTSNFMDDKSYAGPGAGCLCFALWGITFGEGDRITWTPSAHSDTGGIWSLSVFGVEETIGGAVTGATCFAY